MFGKPRHLVSTRFLAAVAIAGLSLGASGALIGTQAGEILTAPKLSATREVGTVGTAVGSIVGNAAWDMGTISLMTPFDRCLAAVEAAELPGWMWECRQYPGQPV